MDNKYKYSFERTANYCYPNSDVLINKWNIRDEAELFKLEREYVAVRATTLEITSIKGNLDFAHLKEIHKYLFQDIFHWAGQTRTCNIAKIDWFCLARYIDTYAEDIFSKFRKQDYFLTKPPEEKIPLIVELFADINALHPFRER